MLQKPSLSTGGMLPRPSLLTAGATAGLEGDALDRLRVGGVDRTHRLPLGQHAVLRLGGLVLGGQQRSGGHVVLQEGAGSDGGRGGRGGRGG